MSLRSKGKIQPEKSNHSTRQTRIRYDEVEIDSGGENGALFLNANEHFTSNIVSHRKRFISLNFFASVRKMSECFSQ